jgi:hypothetical protein
MSLQSSSKTVQSVLESETTTNWEDCIVEELSDEAQAAVSGGKKPTSTTTGYVNFSDLPPEVRAEFDSTANWTATLGG